MPYEFYLESENEKRMFTEKNWREMQEYIINCPHYKINDRLYYIFENDERREAAVPGILSKIANNKNIYTHPCIGFNSASVLVSVVGDNDVDRYLYDFVVWCQKRYPCQLYELSEPVPPEDLLDDEEEIPLIG